jgi:uncharacterized iron-regulated membrane protein
MFAEILHQPRKMWVRRALFQVHLWAGILLAIYAIVISLSGSILVFSNEIRQASLRAGPFDKDHVASVQSVMTRTRERFPTQRLTYIGLPHDETPWWTLYLADSRGRQQLAYAEAASAGHPAPQGRLFIDFVLDLHVYLLAGNTGFVVNCIAGIGLLLLAVTGAVLWWPGVGRWKQGLMVSLRHGWKRINHDLHYAVGIWTLAIVSWWGITAVYFLFPEKLSAVVNVVSPLVGMKEPVVAEPMQNASSVSIDSIIAGLPPGERQRLAGVTLPEKPGGMLTFYVDRGDPGDFSHRDIITIDGHTGKRLAVWHYGENKSLGDWVLWLMYPLHFGMLWGLGVKIVWALLGLSVAILSVTGLLMYWNRSLSKQFI